MLDQSRLDADFAHLLGMLQLHGTLPSDDVAANRGIATAGRALSDEATENLRSWYAHDYELLEVLRGL